MRGFSLHFKKGGKTETLRCETTKAWVPPPVMARAAMIKLQASWYLGVGRRPTELCCQL